MMVSHALSPYTSEEFPADEHKHEKLGVMCGVCPPECVGAQGTPTCPSSGSSCPLHPPPPPRHFICGDGCNGCLGGHVRQRGEALRAVARLEVTASAAEAVGNVRSVRELEGLVHCPFPGCTSEHYSDFSIARHCEEPEVESYLEARQLLTVARAEAAVFDQAQGVLRAAGAELTRLKLGGTELAGRMSGITAREEARSRLAAQLATLFPNARQCGGCGFGPVDHVACEDLAAMHGLEYVGRVDVKVVHS